MQNSKMITLSDLKNKWNKEKNSYVTKEVGSGVQKFVKDTLKSEAIFNLKEGLVSTLLINRRNEFTEESPTKAARRADIIIYITPEIIIPVEVERYENIRAGLEQLFQYQLDLDKKYGILTDGYSWQFYNNTYLLKEFNLSQIFNSPELFNEFWKEYIKPEFYYLSFFEERGQLKILPDDLSVDNRRQDFFRDITTLIRSFKNKLKIEGYLKDLEKKEAEKRAVELTYAYIIQFILYKTLVDNNFGKFGYQFKEKTKAIHECLKIKQYGKVLAIIEGISNEISQNIYRPFKKEQEFINQTVFKLIRQPENELNDVSPWLDIFVFIKKYNFANIQNEIFGYIYENYLKELYEEEKKGQYFTNPAVVNFMLEQIGFTPEKLQKRYQYDVNAISLIDPSCGSGTFLYSAVNSIVKAFGNNDLEKSKQVEKIVNDNIFGLDIAEFPLYLAEMNILMRMLPQIINQRYNNPIDKKIKVFLTKDSVAEFMNTALKNTIHDIDVRGGQLSMGLNDLDLGYKSYVREESDLEEMKKSLENQLEIHRRRFDYVIGNPPYISYNECSKQGVLIMKLIQGKKARMSDIYGVNLNTVPGRIKPYSPKPNLYAFFIALGIVLLKDNGKLCFIIPQTVLTAGDLDVLRYHLSKFTTIEKIITFSGKMFIGRGLKQNKPVATSSLIFVISKRLPSVLSDVEVINYKDANDSVEKTLSNIASGKKISKKRILQNILFQNVANWNFIKHNKQYLDFYYRYKISSIDISSFRGQLKPEEDFSFDGGVIIDKTRLTTGYDDFEIFDYKSNNWNFYTVSRGKLYYSRNSPLSFPPGSQGLSTFLKKFKIIWRTKYANRFQFTDKPILLINNQSLTVTSNSKNELLFYLSLLNSPINKIILNKNLKQENERDYLVPLKAVKSLIRVPMVNEDNQKIKDEIIKRTEELIALEKYILSDFVDFSKIMLQKIDNISVENKTLLLKNDSRIINLPINENAKLVEKTIEEKYKNEKLNLDEHKIDMLELKELPIIDSERQKFLKNYIDDLVFALYFNIPLENLGINKAKVINEICAKNPYYKLISENSVG